MKSNNIDLNVFHCLLALLPSVSIDGHFYRLFENLQLEKFAKLFSYEFRF